MKKFGVLVFLFVAVACVPLSQAGLFDVFANRINEAQEKVSKVINGGIQLIQNEVTKNIERSLVVANKIKQEAEKLVEAIRKEIDNAIKDMEKRINEITNGIDEGVIDECKLLSKGVKEIKDTGLTILTNASYCVTDKIEQISGYIEGINVAAQDEINLLVGINKESIECSKNNTNIASSLYCIGMAYVRASGAVTSEVPKVVINIAKLGATVGTMGQSIFLCSSTTSLTVFYDEINIAVSSINDCIQHKLSQNSTGVPGAGLFS